MSNAIWKLYVQWISIYGRGSGHDLIMWQISISSRHKVILLSTLFIRALRSTQLHVQWVSGNTSKRVKRMVTTHIHLLPWSRIDGSIYPGSWSRALRGSSSFFCYGFQIVLISTTVLMTCKSTCVSSCSPSVHCNCIYFLRFNLRI
jgi:hypothetical protein